MNTSNPVLDARVRTALRAALFVLTCGAAACACLAPDAARAAGGSSAARAVAQVDRLDIRLRSFSPGATGHLTIEASEGGGSLRLTVLNLPDPQTLASGARTYVVWASGDGRILRLGELRRDERGNGGLAFERPATFERYSVIVTAEMSAGAERPGAPVLSTRANEATTLYPRLSRKGASADAAPPPVVAPPPAAAPSAARGTRRVAGDFYAEVEDALASKGGGRVIEFEGERLAPRAGGAARVTEHTGRAYVRANFRGVPLPVSPGATTYVLWAVVPDGRIIYMGSLPATEDLNRAEVYVRVAGFDADNFSLFVTAERARPVHTPSGSRVLTPKNAKLIVK
ncbi:MAG: hypothetical protein LC802_15415 [Acidobacteria bacterium]|nr:hypothetical protein [Acidobacteriota bacterium]